MARRLHRSRTAIIVAIAALAAGTALSACQSTTTPRDSPIGDTATTAPVIETSAGVTQGRPCRQLLVTAPTASPPVAELLGEMTLEEKVSQLFIVGFHGTSVDQPMEIEASFNTQVLGRPSLGDVIAANGLGGVVVFARNADAAIQAAELANGIQEAAAATDRPGMLIAIDHEGGQVSRIETDFTTFPGQAVLGEIDDTALTESIAAATAAQLHALGINVILAPVADVGADSREGPLDDRVFAASAVHVAKHVVATIRGFEGEGTAAAVKHFPGLGGTTTDSHVAMPTATPTLDEWAGTDLVPFAAAVQAGTPIVIVGHTRYPALDESATPATVSTEIVTGELRSCLGFTGVIMTDALEMGAVGSIGSQAETTVLALEAGVDVILATSDFSAAHKAVLAAVGEGRLTEERIDESVGRVLALKEDLGILKATEIPTWSDIDDAAGERFVDLVDRVAAACAQVGLECG